MMGNLLAGTDESPGEDVLLRAGDTRSIGAWVRWMR